MARRKANTLLRGICLLTYTYTEINRSRLTDKITIFRCGKLRNLQYWKILSALGSSKLPWTTSDPLETLGNFLWVDWTHERFGSLCHDPFVGRRRVYLYLLYCGYIRVKIKMSNAILQKETDVIMNWERIDRALVKNLRKLHYCIKHPVVANPCRSELGSPATTNGITALQGNNPSSVSSEIDWVLQGKRELGRSLRSPKNYYGRQK